MQFSGLLFCHLVWIFIDFFLKTRNSRTRKKERKGREREYHILFYLIIFLRVPLFSIVYTMVRYLVSFSFELSTPTRGRLKRIYSPFHKVIRWRAKSVGRWTSRQTRKLGDGWRGGEITETPFKRENDK